MRLTWLEKHYQFYKDKFLNICYLNMINVMYKTNPILQTKTFIEIITLMKNLLFLGNVSLIMKCNALPISNNL
jgi:hypothetical protein